MKRYRTRFLGSFVVVIAAAMLIVTAGCGEDNKPPDDPSYYTGPMKPKDANAMSGGKN